MLRGLLFLVVAAGLVVLVVALVRRTVRREETGRAPSVAPVVVPPPSLPAPAATHTPGLTVEQVLHKVHEVAFACQVGDTQAPQEDIVAAVAESLVTAATEPRYAPRRPMLLPQLLRAVSDTETSRRELSNMIAQDPALVGSLLKLANSQYYRVNAQPVESVDRAVAVIGTDGIRSLIAAALVQPVFRVSGGEFASFPEVVWSHTFLSANAAETYAAVVVNSDPFAAQLLALLNGLGAIVVFRVALDQYASRGTPPDAATIVWLLDRNTASVARNIAASWDLSGRILAALEDQIPGMMAHEPTPLGRALRFGRFVGGLAVLNTRGVVDDEVAKATLLANGAAGAHFERIWERLTGKPPKDPKRSAVSG
jgi:HD-like signal output (HDOD) protein